MINESGQAVVGGPEEIAAFPINDPKHPEIWRVHHKPPARGILRAAAGIALRAAAIYFRYGGLATSAIGLARTGLSLATAANSFRWSGLGSRVGSLDLTTLASRYAQSVVTQRIYAYGSLARVPNLASRFNGFQIELPNATDIRGRVIGRAIDLATPSRADVQESIFDRVDPVRQIERFSDFLLRRKRLAELRPNYMYYFTDLGRPFDKKGLVGVNVHTGQDARFAIVSDPDPMFVTDESSGTLYSIDGSKLQAFEILNR